MCSQGFTHVCTFSPFRDPCNLLNQLVRVFKQIAFIGCNCENYWQWERTCNCVCETSSVYRTCLQTTRQLTFKLGSRYRSHATVCCFGHTYTWPNEIGKFKCIYLHFTESLWRTFNTCCFSSDKSVYRFFLCQCHHTYLWTSWSPLPAVAQV
jgi:hypothetical protein